MPGKCKREGLGFGTQSIYKVTRELRKEQNSLFNCINSITDDAAFVNEIQVLYPTLPLVANLRCGLWYTQNPDGTCYFKSTDGHTNNWGFSKTRLNWHIADAAAKKGGCIIVDATRKGKRFPDSLTKTIPIWAAVINRAVARVHRQVIRKEERRNRQLREASSCVPVDDTQDCILPVQQSPVPYLDTNPSQKDAGTDAPKEPERSWMESPCCSPPLSHARGFRSSPLLTQPSLEEWLDSLDHSRATSRDVSPAKQAKRPHIGRNDNFVFGVQSAPAKMVLPMEEGSEGSVHSACRSSDTDSVESCIEREDEGPETPKLLSQSGAMPIFDSPGMSCRMAQSWGTFEFPSPDQLQVESSSVDSDDEHSLCGVPTMPVVVVNGTPHPSRSAGALLDIWRSVDLKVEDLPDVDITLPPDVAHAYQQQSKRHAWDTSLHLPLWISQTEAAQIESRLDGWVDELLEVGADVHGLAEVLTKPLRPLWVSQQSLIWINQVAQPEDLDFTPLILVSASQPVSYQRQSCRMQDAVGDMGKASDSWSYVYVPGAGDDEESWACGLNPKMFWQHCSELINAGQDGVQEVLKHLLQSGPFSTSVGSLHARQEQPGRVETDQHHHKPRGCVNSSEANVRRTGSGLYWIGSTGVALGAFEAGAPPFVWDTVDAVLNCGARQHEAHEYMNFLGVADSPSGVSLLSSSQRSCGLPVGCLGSGGGTEPWSQEPASWTRQSEGCTACGVANDSLRVSCGSLSDPSGYQKEGDQCPGSLCSPGAPSNRKRSSSPCRRSALTSALSSAQERHMQVPPVISPSEGEAGKCCIPAGRPGSAADVECMFPMDSTAGGDGQVAIPHTGHVSSDDIVPLMEANVPSVPRKKFPKYMWLPIDDSKHDRFSLKRNLNKLLEFLNWHISCGHKVLIHDLDGLDACVCLAVALLLQCQQLSTGAMPQADSSDPSSAGLSPVTKLSVRQKLTMVSAYYPQARPTRGMLKQVFNYFEEARRAADRSPGLQGPAVPQPPVLWQ